MDDSRYIWKAWAYESVRNGTKHVSRSWITFFTCSKSFHCVTWNMEVELVPCMELLWLLKAPIDTTLYRVSLKKGNPSFRVHYSIIKNYFFKNVHIIGKLMFSSFIWHHKHDQWITHDRLHTIWSGTGRNPIVQNKWMAATLGSLWFLTCA